ncbi:oligosaccharyltransferase complex subunit epsilon [Exophiala xenobiotica]|nr:oligosaccharyltransferase complex subunit epsilon [Exophiala xenobiotica]
MAWLVVVGGIQFIYCVLAGNYPFNAFLSGFCAAVGQFVLTASLRMQTSERPPTGASTAAKKSTSKTVDAVSGELVEEGKVSTERAFADFIFGSLILHGFCVNFIN